MSLTTTENEVRSVSLEPQTMRTPTVNISSLSLTALGGAAVVASKATHAVAGLAATAAVGTAKVATAAGGALVSLLKQLADKARAEEASSENLMARQMRLQSVSRKTMEAQAANAPTATAAMEQLMQQPLCFSTTAMPMLSARLAEVVRTGSKDAVVHFAGELAAQNQAVIQQEATHILRESAVTVGLTETVLRASEGYLIARLPGSSMEFRADVTVRDDGKVELKTDMHGFHGTACEETSARIFAEAAKHGLHLTEGKRQSKVRISQTSRRGTLAPASVRARHG